MIFRLTVPIPDKNSDSRIYDRFYYFESKVSPTKRLVLSTLKDNLRRMEDGALFYNGHAVKSDLEIAIQQLETVDNSEFPIVSQLGNIAICNIETRFGTKRLTLALITPMRLIHDFKEGRIEEAREFEQRNPLIVQYD